jgi:hypothetical protein
MDRLPSVAVDVRDMLCAQALAVVAQAVERAHGRPVDVTYNTDDVKQDLLVWARERGLAVDEAAGALRLSGGPR